MRDFRLRWWLWWAIWALPWGMAEPLSAQPFLPELPFAPGEVLVYEVKLGPLGAGTQTLRVVEEISLDGRRAYYVEGVSHPSSLLTKLYHFKDFKASYLDAETLLPLVYRKELEDGNYRGYFRITFLRELGQVDVWKNETEHRLLEIPPDVHDELSMLYYFRCKELRPGANYELTLFNGEKVYPVTVRVAGRERLKGPAGLGVVLVYRLEATDGFKMWLTADGRRLPIRMEAPVKLFGTLQAQLKSWGGVRTLPARSQ